MQEIIQAHYDVLGMNTVAALKKNHFEAEYFSTTAAAREKLLDMIPAGASVGLGGSTTIKTLDIQGALSQRGCKIYDHNSAADPAGRRAVARQELLSDVFLASSNAITADGRLYNMDGMGNRVAAMIFGPGQVILVAGINKVVADLPAAIQRVEMAAAPINCMRIKAPTACTYVGHCMDCSSERRICNAGVVLHRKPSGSQMTILLVGEVLGF